MEINDVAKFKKKFPALFMRREMEMLATRAKTLRIKYSKKSTKPMKKSRLVRKRNDKQAANMDRATEIIETIIGVHQMFQNLQTKYGITRDELKRLV